MVSGVNSFAKGETTRLDWFRPAVRPGFSDSFGVYNSRWGDFMTWNVQDWSSISDRMRLGGFLPWGETPTHLQVFQGDTRIHDNQYSSDMQWKEVPAGNRPTGSSSTPRGRPTSSGSRPAPTPSGGSCPTRSRATTSSRSR